MLGPRYEDPTRAEAAGRKFVELWRGRAWVLTDTGSTAFGEPIYQFTHRTFLEYFAAMQLVRKYPTPTLLWKQLHGHLRKREWDMLAQLSIQLMNASHEGATDQLLNHLVRAAQQGTVTEAVNLLTFASQYLDILMPSPRVCRQVARACVDLFLEGNPAWRTMPKYEDFLSRMSTYIADNSEEWELDIEEIQEEDLMQPLLNVLSTSDDIAGYVQSEVTQYCRRRTARKADDDAGAALLLSLHLGMLKRISLNQHDAELTEDWREVYSEAELRSRLKKFAPGDFALALSGARLRLLTVAQLVEWHGLDPLFCRTHVYPYLYRGTSSTVPSIAESIIRRLIAVGPEDLGQLDRQEKEDIRVICEAFRARFSKGVKRVTGFDREWLAIDVNEESDLYRHIEGLSEGQHVDREAFDQEDQRGKSRRLLRGLHARQGTHPGTAVDPEVLFCGAALLCVFGELEQWNFAWQDRYALNVQLGCLQELQLILFSRSSPSFSSDARIILAESNLLETDRNILIRWVSRTLSFERVLEISWSE